MTSLADKVARVKELDATLPPHMAMIFRDHLSIITQLWEENRKQREVLGMARGLLEVYFDHWESYDECGYLGVPVYDDTKQTITAIDNVMKGEGV